MSGPIDSSVQSAHRPTLSSTPGLTLLEVLISLAIIGSIGMIIFMFQTSTWKRSIASNRTVVAGQMIEQQVESMRMAIAQNPSANFPPSSGSTSGNGVRLVWTISSAQRPLPSPKNTTIDSVRQCTFTASWGSGKWDTLTAITYLAKKF